ncbi:MAG: C-terminal binding protein, partial [Spirochaetaceae bacterium]|nr:C-terminal binding protein [Spirochaetaceae bacterium]
IVFVNLGQKFDSTEIRDEYYKNITGYLRSQKFDLVVEDGDEYDKELTLKLLKDADGVIFSSNGPMSRDVIEKLPRLKLIQRYGIGLNSIDLEAATEFGKAVCYTPGYCSEEVGIHGVAMGLAALRNITYYDKMTRKGIWLKGNGLLPRRPWNMTMGIFALGASGSIIAKAMGQGFGAKVIAYDPYVAPEAAKALNVEMVSFDELLKQSDMIFINAPLTKETRRIFNDDAFAKMKDGSILVNVSRGGIVDTQAMTRALNSGKLAKAALDVFEKEPLDPNEEFLKNDYVTVTPHSAYYGREALDNADYLIGHIPARFFLDKKLYKKNLANPAVMDKLPGYTLVDAPVE